jgi:MFS family permease
VRTVFLLGLTSFLTDVASEMVYPFLPLFLSSIGTAPFYLGLIEGLAESAASLLKPVSGMVSDRTRRRKPMTLAGYSLSVTGKLLLAAAPGWGLVLAARLVDRFGKGIRTAPRDAWIADSSPPDTRGASFGLHRAMDTAGAAVGSLLGYAIFIGLSASVRSVFLLAVVPAIAAAGVLALTGEAKKREPSPPVERRLPRFSLLPRQLRLLFGIVLLFSLGNSSNTFLLLRASGAGCSAGTVVLFYVVYSAVYAASSYPGGRLSDRVPRQYILVAGYGVYAAVYLGFALLQDGTGVWPFWILFPAYGLFSGLTDGVERALVADLAPGSLRATALGVHALVVGLGVLPASLLTGWLWTSSGPALPLVLSAGCAAAAAALLGLFPRSP